ncbi:MAG: Deoxyuridine 5-triphosphate nucleotidohydrolase Dut [Jatrophihabitantaceae bacterium]|nr:Deoxyuridine 5-triphosphate nucleotidohydrolase Dut [Jatrophihabitantaceae bacterium]
MPGEPCDDLRGTASSVDGRPLAAPVLTVQVLRVDPEAPLPSYARHGDAGADLITTRDVRIGPGEREMVGTGIAIALPIGYAAFVHPRSGLAARVGLSIVNTPGTIDAGYRGEIRLSLINHDLRTAIVLRRGDRIAQLVIQRVEHAHFEAVDALPVSDRGDGGYGSTGGAHALAGDLLTIDAREGSTSGAG